MTMSAKPSEVRNWVIRLTVTTVIVMTLIADSSCTAGIIMPKGYEEDPLTVVRVFSDALNAKMIDTALGLVDDEVVFIDATGQARNGKTSVRNWMETQARQNENSELVDLWIAGNTVTWTARIHAGDSIGMGKSEALVLRGKIKSLKVLSGR